MTTLRTSLRFTRIASLALSLVVSVLIAGCARTGYRFGSNHSRHIETVAIPVFENDTFDHDASIRLTEAIAKEIARETGWRVTGRDVADTVILGTIVDSSLNKLSTASGAGFALEQDVALTVDFEFRDNRSGETLVARRNFSAVDTFVPSHPSREPIDVAQYGVIQELARDIVRTLAEAW